MKKKIITTLKKKTFFGQKKILPPAFSYGAEGHGIPHHRHQALGPSDGRVQQLGVGQEPKKFKK